MTAAPPLPSNAPQPWLLDHPVGALACHVAGPEDAPPLLLVHSVNAAAGVHEVAPLLAHYAATRRVYALELPGYGASARPDVAYTPALMTSALSTATDAIASRHAHAPIDALALSLSCEFLARAAQAAPARYRSLALVSPTGFSGTQPAEGPAGSTRALPRLHAWLAHRPWSRPLFDLLTSRRSVRYFLRRTFGRQEVDETLIDAAWRAARHPQAHHAPLCFLSGFMFSRDMAGIYRALSMPVWMVHGVRGDFTDYRQKTRLGLGAQWHFAVMQTGAIPWFEELAGFLDAYSRFLAAPGAPDGPASFR